MLREEERNCRFFYLVMAQIVVFEPELGIMLSFASSHYVHVGFLQVLHIPPTSQKMSTGGLTILNFP